MAPCFRSGFPSPDLACWYKELLIAVPNASRSFWFTFASRRDAQRAETHGKLSAERQEKRRIPSQLVTRPRKRLLYDIPIARMT